MKILAGVFIGLFGFNTVFGSDMDEYEAASRSQLNIKNFREIYASYVSITDLSEIPSSLRELYKLNIDRLPKKGTSDELSSGVVLALTELGGAFCDAALTQEAQLDSGERTLFTYLDFTLGTSQFSDFIIESTLENLGLSFWQREPNADEMELLKSITIKMASESTDEIIETVHTAHVMCTVFASSLSFLVK